MKPRAEKTARRTGLETLRPVRRNCRASVSDASTGDRLAFHRNALQIILPLLLTSCCFNTSAIAQPVGPNVGQTEQSLPQTHPENPVNPVQTIGIDGIDCITSYDPPSPGTGYDVARTEEAPTQVCDNSPDPWNGLGETATVTDDDAVIPSGDDKDPPQFTGASFDKLTRRLLSISSLRQPEQSPYNSCLLAHIRERAPPTLI